VGIAHQFFHTFPYMDNADGSALTMAGNASGNANPQLYNLALTMVGNAHPDMVDFVKGKNN